MQTLVQDRALPVGEAVRGDSPQSGVSWAAVFAGAAAAAGVSLLLLLLGVGLGLSATSPWSYSGDAIGRSTIVWLAFTQLAAGGIGGYLAGRLRVKWADVHNDEVFFRDTAHGFLAWAVATLLMASAMTGATRDIIGGAANAAGKVANVAGLIGAAGAGGAGAAAAQSQGASADPTDYFAASMLRSEKVAPSADDAELRREVAGIMASSLRAGSLSAEDRGYLAQRLASRNGIEPQAAEQRVNQVYDSAAKAAADAKASVQNAAEAARKAAAKASIWMFVALLLGAFIASLCATFGGRQRDQ